MGIVGLAYPPDFKSAKSGCLVSGIILKASATYAREGCAMATTGSMTLRLARNSKFSTVLKKHMILLTVKALAILSSTVMLLTVKALTTLSSDF